MLFILQAKEGLISNYGKHLLIVSIVSPSPPSSTKRFSAAMAASVPTSNQWSKLGGSWDPQTFPTRVRKIQIVLYFKRAKDLNGFSPLRFNRKKGEKLQTIAMIFANLSVVVKFPLSPSWKSHQKSISWTTQKITMSLKNDAEKNGKKLKRDMKLFFYELRQKFRGFLGY